MEGLRSEILDKFCTKVFRASQPAYFIMDAAGSIQDWGGKISSHHLATPVKGMPISDIVVFMEGLLPLQKGPLEFSCIKTEAGSCLDALVFKLESGYGLILWDASQKEAFLTQTQQQCNELSLLIEEQKARLKKISGPRGFEKNTDFLEDLFQALNFAVLEMNRNQEFVLLGSPPQWIDKLFQSHHLISGAPLREDPFSFLGNFIQEAKTRWLKNPRETIKSGIWIEKDHTGQEYLFEATAVVIHGKKMLIIANNVCDPFEKQAIIQKGRDLALHYHSLKRDEQKLKLMHDELETRVRQRTQDLERANLKLAEELMQRKRLEKEREEVAKQLRQSQKMEAIGTLAGGIAHDFNNILGGIIGFSELCLTQAPEPLKPKLNQILNASERAKDLVRQILTFSHKTEYEKRPIRLCLVIEEVLNLLRASFPASIEIQTDLKSQAYILADQTQIHQVLMNLCTNAWHAMKEKGGTLKIELKEVDLSPPTMVDNSKNDQTRCLELIVSDTGCGIKPDILERIFDPYFTTKEKDKGTGLGLSVVLGIVEKSGGQIRVDSRLGSGTRFKILFPCFDANTQAAPYLEPLILGNNERILFVDDETYQTEMIEQIMEQLGYRVVTCNDSLKALDLFLSKDHEFDLVITDMLMPKMTGKTLAQKILETDPHMPIILCSGYHEDLDSNEFKKIGIRQVLMKPFGMHDLSREIKSILKTVQ